LAKTKKTNHPAPVKWCPSCGNSNHAAARTCTHCEHAFVFAEPEEKMTDSPHVDPLTLLPQRVKVNKVQYTSYPKNGYQLLLISYGTDIGIIQIYLHFKDSTHKWAFKTQTAPLLLESGIDDVFCYGDGEWVKRMIKPSHLLIIEKKGYKTILERFYE
jgi:hypothetical protein